MHHRNLGWCHTNSDSVAIADLLRERIQCAGPFLSSIQPQSHEVCESLRQVRTSYNIENMLFRQC